MELGFFFFQKNNKKDEWGSWDSSKKDPDFVWDNSRGDKSQSKNRTNPLDEVKAIFDQYDRRSPNCRFECILYNKVPLSDAHKFHKPPLVRPQVWDQGVKQNPDPKQLVPVAIRGFADLEERANLCLAGHLSCHTVFEDLSNKLNDLRIKINRKLQDDIQELKRTQIVLSRRLLVVMRQYIEISTGQVGRITYNAMPSGALDGRFDTLNPNEMQLKQVLHRLLRESRTIVSQFQHVDELLHTVNSTTGSVAEITRISTEPINPKMMQNMFEFLKNQQQLIRHMTQTIDMDLEDLKVIEKGFDAEKKHSLRYSGVGMF